MSEFGSATGKFSYFKKTRKNAFEILIQLPFHTFRRQKEKRINPAAMSPTRGESPLPGDFNVYSGPPVGLPPAMLPLVNGLASPGVDKPDKEPQASPPNPHFMNGRSAADLANMMAVAARAASLRMGAPTAANS